MSRTSSHMIPLQSEAPNFDLLDTVTLKNISLKTIKGNKATVIFFICNHCPFVIHVNEELIAIAHKFGRSGVSFVAISSNDIEHYPQDAPIHMKQVAIDLQYPFPYLFDGTQEVASAYKAACTPDIYVFDKELKLVYRGQLDDSRPGNEIPVSGRDLRSALKAIVEGSTVSTDQQPSIGCNIKWKQM